MYNSIPAVGWVKSSNAVRGQDPLGVRAPCEHVYNKLLPGITNVTDRARYFSFYPWLIWSIEQKQEKLRKLPLYHLVRRADCLLTMIGAYHHSILGNNLSHGALIGSIKLSSVVSQIKETREVVKLSTYASTDTLSNRYFQNKLGGLGQYYIAPLRDAGILDGNLSSGVHYTKERGLVLAQAFEEDVNSEDFFKVIEADEVSEADLADLVNFCPCNIGNDSVEQQTLVDFFFNREGIFYDESCNARTETLSLLLDLLAKFSDNGLAIQLNWSGAQKVLACTYSKSLPEKISWIITQESLEENRIGWQQYEAGDLLSYALQSLFWAGLGKLFQEDVYLPNSSAYGQWFIDRFSPHLNIKEEERFADAIERINTSLPFIEDWQNENHEIQLAWQISEILNDKSIHNKHESIVPTAFKLLLTLAARWKDSVDEKAFSVILPPKFLEAYPVNLFSFIKASSNGWREKSLSDWLKWLTAKWNIEIHLRVALRKLNHESLDTFKIIPTDNGLRVIDSVAPTFTSPRLKPALQILLDIGTVRFNENLQSLEITPLGKQILEERQRG